MFYDLGQKKVIKEVAAPMLVFAAAMNESGDVIDTVGRGQVVRWGLKVYRRVADPRVDLTRRQTGRES
jgi:hypothetical protein